MRNGWFASSSRVLCCLTAHPWRICVLCRRHSPPSHGTFRVSKLPVQPENQLGRKQPFVERSSEYGRTPRSFHTNDSLHLGTLVRPQTGLCQPPDTAYTVGWS